LLALLIQAMPVPAIKLMLQRDMEERTIIFLILTASASTASAASKLLRFCD
jgi:hypothetical protein